jgi:tRNA threonylcarbamoyladenosine biosynthesis protein TsaB
VSTEENIVNFPALVVDGSGTSIFTGVLGARGRWLAKSEQDVPALEGLFPSVEDSLQQAGLQFADIRSYLYCEGPGSSLGLRLCAMAIETWTRLFPDSANLFSYNSLHLTAANLLVETPDIDEALIVTDWKKGAWNSISITDGKMAPIEVIDEASLATSERPLYHLPQRKGWQQAPPQGAIELSYKPCTLNRILTMPSLLKSTGQIELYNSGINTFQKWIPTRHRAAP